MGLHSIIKMNTIFMNSESSNTSESYVLILRLTDKLDLGRREKSMALSNLRIYYAWENIKSKITKDKNGANVLHLKITEVLLVHFNSVNNHYQQDLRVLYTFVSNKPFGSLLGISRTNHIFLKSLNSEFQAIEVWFTNQNSQPIEIENIINLLSI